MKDDRRDELCALIFVLCMSRFDLEVRSEERQLYGVLKTLSTTNKVPLYL
jgi:hypothetical protein